MLESLYYNITLYYVIIERSDIELCVFAGERGMGMHSYTPGYIAYAYNMKYIYIHTCMLMQYCACMYFNAYMYKLTGSSVDRVSGDTLSVIPQLISLTFHTHCYHVHCTRLQ